MKYTLQYEKWGEAHFDFFFDRTGKKVVKKFVLITFEHDKVLDYTWEINLGVLYAIKP